MNYTASHVHIKILEYEIRYLKHIFGILLSSINYGAIVRSTAACVIIRFSNVIDSVRAIVSNGSKILTSRRTRLFPEVLEERYWNKITKNNRFWKILGEGDSWFKTGSGSQKNKYFSGEKGSGETRFQCLSHIYQSCAREVEEESHCFPEQQFRCQISILLWKQSIYHS